MVAAIAVALPYSFSSPFPTREAEADHRILHTLHRSIGPSKALVKNLDFYYGASHVLKNINLPIQDKAVTALIGPSGCGKSTLLRCFNRMHDLVPSARYDGEILLAPENENILDRNIDPLAIRMRISMVFQKPNSFPKSIYENVAYGLRTRGIKNKGELDDRVEATLQDVTLWNEVKDRLNDSGTALSGGQQQRLCMARALATNPEMILFDEPTSALDPIATAAIEDLIARLSGKVTMIIVTHNMQQAARVSQNTAFLYLGEVVEFAPTRELFSNPTQRRTEDYITGKFG